MNFASWVILGVILLLLVVAVAKVVRSKKKGKCIGCPGCSETCSCSHGSEQDISAKQA